MVTSTARTLPAPVFFANEPESSFVAGALLPWLAILPVPGQSRVPVTFVVVLAALALTGWVSARMSHVKPIAPMVRTASIGGPSMLITYFTGHFLYPLTTPSAAARVRRSAFGDGAGLRPPT